MEIFCKFSLFLKLANICQHRSAMLVIIEHSNEHPIHPDHSHHSPVFVIVYPSKAFVNRDLKQKVVRLNSANSFHSSIRISMISRRRLPFLVRLNRQTVLELICLPESWKPISFDFFVRGLDIVFGFVVSSRIWIAIFSDSIFFFVLHRAGSKIGKY